MTHLERAEDAERARFTARLVVLETPDIARKIARMAESSGHSLAAEVRAALRFWIAQWEDR
jgi:hypothetical protein